MLSSRSAEITIPLERIVRELSKSAQPGFYGHTTISITLLPEVLRGVKLDIHRERKIRSTDQPDQVRVTDEETEREKSVGAMCRKFAGQLCLRAKVSGLVAHWQDGFLKDLDLVEDEAGNE